MIVEPRGFGAVKKQFLNLFVYKPIGNDHGIEFRARVLGAGPILGALTFGVMVVVGGALTLIPGGQAVGAAVIAVAPETAAAATALPTP